MAPKRSLVFSLIFVLLVLPSVYAGSSNSTSVSEWRMLGRTLDNNRNYPENLNMTNFVNLWNYTTGGWILSSAAVADGIVYIGSNDNRLYALSASNGTQIWNYTTSGDIRSSPAVVDGVVYIGSYDHSVYALNATNGSKIWNYTTSNIIQYSSPAVVNGIVYIGSLSSLYALNATNGSKIWNYSIPSMDSSPAISEGVLYIDSDNNHSVYALNATTGAHIWNYTAGDNIYFSVAVANGTVYAASDDYRLYALNATNGSKIWGTNLWSWIWSSPSVAGDLVVIGITESILYALNTTSGSSRWSYTLGDGVYISTPTMANGMVYIGCQDYKVYAFGPSPNNAPNVTLNSPSASYTNNTVTSLNVTFNCSATDDHALSNISLYITNNQNSNFARNQTANVSGLSNSTTWSLNLTTGYYTWNCLASDSQGLGSSASSNRTITIGTAGISVILNSPPNSTNTSNTNATFNCSASDDLNLVNITLYGNWSGGWHANETKSLTGTSNSTTFSKTLAEGNYVWNCKAYDILNDSVFASSNYSLTIDATKPTVNRESPENNTLENSTNTIAFKYNTSDANPIANCSLIINNVLNQTNVSVTKNTTQNFTLVLTNGNYNWSVNCTDYSGNMNGSATHNLSINVNTTPTTELVSPANVSTWTSSSTVTFNYNVTANADIENCSLLINDQIDQTDTSVTKDTTQSFAKTLSNGNYNWSVNCYDSVHGNQGNSNTNYLTVSYTPVSNTRRGTGGGGGGGATTEKVNATKIPEAINASTTTIGFLGYENAGTINKTINISSTASIEGALGVTQKTYNQVEVVSVSNEEIKSLVLNFKDSAEGIGVSGVARAAVEIGLSMIGELKTAEGLIGKFAGFFSTAEEISSAAEGALLAVKESQEKGISKGAIKGGAAIIPGGKYAYNAINGISTQSRLEEVIGSSMGAKVVYIDIDKNGKKEVVAFTLTKAYVLEVQ